MAVVVAGGPAFAAGVFVSPADNFTYQANAKGDPIPQDVVSTNFPAQVNVFTEICDGKSPSAQGYDVTLDCDPVTSKTQIQSQGPTTNENFTVATKEAPSPFRGVGGSGQFNCLAPEDVKAGPPNRDGSVTPIGSLTKNGQLVDPTVASWTNCKVRVSSNNASNTNDQTFITFALSNGGSAAQTPSISPVTGNPTSSTVGSPVTLTTTVTGTPGNPGPTGSVTFDSLGGTPIGGCTAAPVGGNGTATCTTTSLPAGTDSLTAVYSGDALYGSVTSTAATYTVGQATPTVVLSSIPVSQAGTGSTVTFKATVTGVSGGPAPTGTVTFKAGSTAIATCTSAQLTGGTASCTTSFPSAGNQSIVASYSGDTNYTGGTPAAETFDVVPLPAANVAVTSAPAAPTYGQAVTVTATVTPPAGTPGTPTGTVAFTTGTGATPTPITGCGAVTVAANGTATCPLPTGVAVGATTVNATYSGDTHYGGSTGTTTVTITRAVPTVSLSSVPTTKVGTGSNVTFTALVTGPAGASAPTGTVAFSAGGTALATCGSSALASGAATCTTSFPAAGNQTIVATYSGDTNYTGGTPATETLNVVTLPSANVAVTATPPSSTSGQSVTLAAAVSAPAGSTGTPTGTVSFTINGTAFDTACSSLPLANGSATCATAKLPVGTDTVTAAYSGDSAFAGASGTTTETVTQAATTVTVAPPTPASPVAGTPVTITATIVTPSGTTPAGTVDFTAAIPNAPAVDIAGCAAQPMTTSGGSTTAVCTTSTLAAGVNTIVATYKPATGSNVSSAPINYTIKAAVTPPPASGTHLASATPAATSPVAATLGSGTLGTSGPSTDTSGAVPSSVAAGSGGQAAQHGVSVPLAATMGAAGLGLLGEAWRRRRCR